MFSTPSFFKQTNFQVTVESPFSSSSSDEHSLEVPEEPVDSDEGGGGRGGPEGGGTTPLAYVTAFGIARWMAKAYGFRARKKLEYNSQDRVRAERVN